jgi:F-box protein 9
MMRDVAIADVADFVRLSLVCKKFAFLVAREQRIWRRVCLGSEVGFAGMHYHWQCGISWEPLGVEGDGEPEFVSMEELAQKRRDEALETTKALLPLAYSSSWLKMFRSRPRIRFNGCYISTVNYIRSGQASAHQTTWNSPVHIVTYYRYLRFYRDGTVVSLLTTEEPAEVVHYMTKEALELHQDGEQMHIPSAVMHLALRGRWRLASSLDNPDAALNEAEGDLYVETEGASTGKIKSKYIYRLELSLRSAGKGTKNNKLVWRGFYSYNKTTDDWGEFALKNDKPYFFSRVKSYGAGE